MSSEIAFQANDNIVYSAASLSYLWIFFALFALWLILLVVMLIVRCFSRTEFKKLQSIDALNVVKYEIPGPVLKGTTIPGGLLTILTAFMIFGLFIYVLLTYISHNEVMVSGIGAGFSTTDMNADYINIEVKMYGFSGTCTTGDPKLQLCAPGVSILQDGFENIGDYTCSQENRTCTLVWTSPTSTKFKSGSTVYFNVFSQPSSAYAILWNVSVNSVYDKLDSYVTGFLLPDTPASVFRGSLDNGESSYVQVTVIPTTLTTYNSDDVKNGLTVDFLARFSGSQTTADTYYADTSTQGVSVGFELQVPQFVYQKQILQRMTTISVISNFIALVGGIFGISKTILLVFWTGTRIKHKLKQQEEKRKSKSFRKQTSEAPIEMEDVGASSSPNSRPKLEKVRANEKSASQLEKVKGSSKSPKNEGENNEKDFV